MDFLKDFTEKINGEIMGYLPENEPAKLYEAVKYLPAAGGKRLRPIMAMLACEAAGGNGENAIPFGIALEITHTFTLIHDDIMDRDEERRGMPAVHKKFGEATAILAGDALFAKAFEIATGTDASPEVVKTLVRNLAVMSREICEGQQMDMGFEEADEVAEEEFLLMIEKKTAKMFEHAAMGGAIISGAGREKQEALQNYGRNVGMAFQIWDDCLDVIGKGIGKPVGSDIREGKKTLIFIHAMRESTEKERLAELYGKEDMTDDELDEVMDMLKRSNSLDYAKEMALRFSETARKNLEKLEEGRAREMLEEIARFAVEREK